MNNGTSKNPILLLLIVVILCAYSSIEFLGMRKPDLLIPSKSLTAIKKLSNYFKGMKNTSADSDIYFFDSGKPGGTVLLLGGTHPNEPAGFITAVVLLEQLKCEEGRVIIIPQACLSGFTCTDPLEGYPSSFTVKGKYGDRKFRFGSRVANPLDQWPDPLVYQHYPSGQKLSNFESRNLNRCYPGNPEGSLMQQTAYAILQLIRSENVDVAFDLHEAAPEIPIINAIVAHEKARDVAGMAVLNLEFEDLKYALEISPVRFRGLSHREWGDSTTVFPFLMETSNPIQGRLRGVTNEKLVLYGTDQNYKKALESGKLRIEYLVSGEPLKLRVGRHLQAFLAVLSAFNELNPDKHITVSKVPGYHDLMINGVGFYLN